MYQLIKLPKLLGLFASLFAAIFVVVGYARGLEGWDWLKAASTIITVLTTVIVGVGQSPLFPKICRYPPLKWFFYDIDGKWKGENRSNWPRIETRDPNAALLTIDSNVEIEARLLHINVHLRSNNEYSISDTLFVRIRKVDGKPQLIYAYRNRTNNPKVTDEQSHLGAAMLDIVGDGTDMRLKGPYWTNRNWNRGLNTAGELELRRV